MGIVQKPRILEIGCGRGVILEERINLEGKQYFGIDIRPVVLNWGSADRVLVAGDGNSLPFRDSSFDEIVCQHTLEHMKQYENLMGEIHRILKMKGRVEISVPHPNYEQIMAGISPDYHGPRMHLRVVTKQELVNLVKPYFDIQELNERRGYRAYLNIHRFKRDPSFEDHTGLAGNLWMSPGLKLAMRKSIHYLEDRMPFAVLMRGLYHTLGIPPYETHLVGIKKC